MEIAMTQSRIMPLEKLGRAYMDRGTYFGDGVYEVLRSYKGKIFALEEHLERFTHSLVEIGMTGVNIAEVRSKILKAYKHASIEDAKIYFHMTRGSEPRSHVGKAMIEPNFLLTITQIDENEINRQKTEGIAVSTEPDWRWKRCDIKSLNLLANVLASRNAAKKGCQEALLVNERGEITEGAGSAFFAISRPQGELVTRPLGRDVLPSITRGIVLQIAEKAQLKAIERPITPRQALQADELFIAVTTKDVVGVVKFDNRQVGDGQVGTFTKILMIEFQNEIKKRTETEL